MKNSVFDLPLCVVLVQKTYLKIFHEIFDFFACNFFQKKSLKKIEDALQNA